MFDEKANSNRNFHGHNQAVPESMDTSYVSRNQTRRFPRAKPGSRNVNTTMSNPTKTQTQGRSSNPPGGMQKRLQREYHGNPRPQTRDISKDRCNKCKLLGHWARDCPSTNTVATADIQEDHQPTMDASFDYEEQDWMETGAINSINGNEFPELGLNCVCQPTLN